MKRFTDRVSIITSGASGIGLATAKRLAIEGARVVIADVMEQSERQVRAGKELSPGTWASRMMLRP